MHIRTTHRLLTGLWTADVQALEKALDRLEADVTLTNDCHVAFFEVDRDRHIHVNVTHRHPTRTIPGWAGPARLRSGFVHNRTFADAPRRQIIRDIREMVVAPRMARAA